MIDGGRFAGHDLATGRTWQIEEVVADLDRWHVARALVGSYRSIYQDVIEGARDAASWASRFPDRIEPIAYLTTSYYGESAERLMVRLKEMGIRVVALVSAPAFTSVAWDAPATRAIGEAAARTGLALQAGVRDESELAAVARAWGDIKADVMIRWFGGHRYRAVASEVALAARWTRAHFDIGTLASSGLVAWLASTIGPDRLFVASNTPFHIAACPYLILTDAVLDDPARAAISSGTLSRMLPTKASETTATATDIGWSALLRRPKVDVHWHPDHNNLGEPGLTEADQRASFDRYGYEAVIMSSDLALYGDLAAGNEVTRGWTRRDRRVFGLIVVDPLRRDLSISEIERYGSDARFVGLKTIQDLYGLGLDDHAYDPLLECAAAAGLPVMAHLTGMDRAAERHSDVTFVAAHANWGRAAHLAARGNVVFDFSTSHAGRQETQLARFVATVGADRVLFGSDAQLLSPAWSLAKLLDADLSDADQQAILHENAYRVFRRLKGS